MKADLQELKLENYARALVQMIRASGCTSSAGRVLTVPRVIQQKVVFEKTILKAPFCEGLPCIRHVKFCSFPFTSEVLAF